MEDRRGIQSTMGTSFLLVACSRSWLIPVKPSFPLRHGGSLVTKSYYSIGVTTYFLGHWFFGSSRAKKSFISRFEHSSSISIVVIELKWSIFQFLRFLEVNRPTFLFLKFKSKFYGFFPLQNFFTTGFLLLFKLDLFVSTLWSFPFNSSITCSKYLLDENLHGNSLFTGVSSITKTGSMNLEPSSELNIWISVTCMSKLGFAIKWGMTVSSTWVKPFWLRKPSQLSPICDRWETNSILMSLWWNRLDREFVLCHL